MIDKIPIGSFRQIARRGLVTFVFSCIFVIIFLLHVLQIATETGQSITSVLKYPDIVTS